MHLLELNSNSYITEEVAIGRQNYFPVRLTSNYEGVATTDITKIKVLIGDVWTESTNQAGDPILWGQTGYETGEVRFQLGEVEGLVEGRYPRCFVIVCDSTYTTGRLWGIMQLFCFDDAQE